MSRYARQKSATRVYHIMLRGIDKMSIFQDDDDNGRFLETMDKMKKGGEYELYAYCLMVNHVHLLLAEGEDTVQRSIKRIGVSYAYYYNSKYGRVGHVFQDRFRSENIEDDRYLMTAVRYIHNNPVKAGMAIKAGDYRWSSYPEYINPGIRPARINTRVVLGLFSDNSANALEQFRTFTDETVQEEFIDVGNQAEKPEKHACKAKDTVELLLKDCGYSLDGLKHVEDRRKRNEMLKMLKESTAMSARELSGILGISKDMIARAG